MIDTIAASISVPRLSVSWQGSQSTQGRKQFDRYWLNDGTIRCTYFISDRDFAGRLRIEFSVPKLLDISTNITHEQVIQAIDKVNVWLRERISPSLPDVREWKCSRIDYAWNFTSADSATYLAMMQSLSLSRMARFPYDGSGVVWKSSKGHRWIKWYRKSDDTLRFEVSNYQRAVRYMARRWFGCDGVVRDMIHAGRALYCLAALWSKLGLQQAQYSMTDPMLLSRLHGLFGSAAPSAFYALTAIKAFGAQAHRSGLMSSNTYYKWQRQLKQHGLLVSLPGVGDAKLPGLRLPVRETLWNLNKATPPPVYLGVCCNFADFLAVLGLTKAPELDFLTKELADAASEIVPGVPGQPGQTSASDIDQSSVAGIVLYGGQRERLLQGHRDIPGDGVSTGQKPAGRFVTEPSVGA